MWSYQPSFRADYQRIKSPSLPSNNSRRSFQEPKPSDSQKLTKKKWWRSRETKLSDYRKKIRAGSTLKCITELNKPLPTKLSTSNRGKSTRWPKDKSATRLLFKRRWTKLNLWGPRKLRRSSKETMRTRWPNSHPLKSHRANILISAISNTAYSARNLLSSTKKTLCLLAHKITFWRKIRQFWRKVSLER